VRVLYGIGAFFFAWLDLIPFSLLASALDDACAGPGCETSLAVRVLLAALYVACLLALAGTALLMADYAVRGSERSYVLVPYALRALAGAVGVTLFMQFCLISPIGGVIATLAGIVAWRVLRRHSLSSARLPRDDPLAADARRRAAGPPADPNLN
jgi:hypothetical protein